MYKVGICGHFGNNKQFLDGQTVKTKILTEELRKALGSDSVLTLDTNNWRSNPFSLFFRCFFLIFKCENVIILPAHNGLKVFGNLFVILNKLFRRKIHYVVIGGWLPDLLVKNHRLKKTLSKFDGIYIETNIMVESLQKLNLNNVRHLTNFKRLDILEESELVYQKKDPFKLCTFSRVMEEKGIEDAIKAVKAINNSHGKELFKLDIYGQIDERYKERFEELKKNFPNYISYKGVVDFNESSKVLKEYYALLFPTHFKTEGVPGTIIDAYTAGVPVIASQWNYANEIINHDETGYIYDFMQNSKLEDLLIQIYEEPSKINKMKKLCLKRAKQFSTETVIKDFTKYL